MQPEEIPTVAPVEDGVDVGRLMAEECLSEVKDRVERLLRVTLASPRTRPEQDAVKDLGWIRDAINRTMSRIYRAEQLPVDVPGLLAGITRKAGPT